jgi:hypothetical protein
MKNVLKPVAWALLLVSALTISSCKKDEEVAFALSTLKAGTIDLNGAATAAGVPANSTVTATFTQNISAASVVTLQRDYDKAMLPVTITASGKTLTIDPNDDLGMGTLYIMAFTGLKSENGEVLPAFNRSFNTEGGFVPTGQVAYWSFEDNANDLIGNHDPAASDIVAVTYVAGRNTKSGKAASFNGETSIIEAPNGPDLVNTSNFTLGFWVKPVSDNKTSGHFVMGIGAAKGFQFEISGDYGSCKLAAQYDLGAKGTGGEDLWFNGSGEDKDHGGWQGWDFVKDLKANGGVPALLKDKWAHIVCVYDAASKKGTMYINGEKMKGQDFNLWPDGDAKRSATGLKFVGTAPEVGNKLAFGFLYDRSSTWYNAEPWGNYSSPASNHFKGQLDDVRIFSKALTAQEVKLVYDSEK